MTDQTSSAETYAELLASIKDRIRSAQVRAAVAVNQELVLLYWGIGKEILARQQAEGWGKNIIGRLAKDLRAQFPAMDGLSPRNLGYMKAFAQAWPDEAILQTLLAKLTWYHNISLIQRVKDLEARIWYANQAIQYGWSRNILVMQIESHLYHRQGKALTNFDRTLPLPQSDLAHQLLKDPYNFDFLTLSSEAQERDIERGLLAHLRSFLLELGVGFSFVGSQYPLTVAGGDYKLDLLFYGKMNFYLAAVDDLIKHPTDQPSIGLILCKSKKEIVVEYALRNTTTPMGIAEFRYLETLPEGLKGSLPTVEEIEAELASADDPET